MVSLSERLKELRIANGFKQADVAACLGIIRQTYAHYEAGDRQPNTETLYKIASIYSITINDLMKGVVTLDPEVFYDMPMTDLEDDIDGYERFLRDPDNKDLLKGLSTDERKLLYFYKKLDKKSKNELIEFAKIMDSSKDIQ